MSNTFILKQQLTDAEYMIHDNGGIPFKVITNNDGIFIYTFKSYDRDLNVQDYSKLVLSFKDFLGYWSGYDSSGYNFHGNSILIQIDEHKYIYIGYEIYRFRTDDIIIDYETPIGNSDVPYPVAFGETDIYFMIENCILDRQDLKTPIVSGNASELYNELYCINSFKGHKCHQKYNIKHKKVLVKRKF